MAEAASSVFCVAETEAGKVEGVVNGGVRQFKNVPYGASTGGDGRFRPPRPPQAWRGVRPCFGYGPASPQQPIGVDGVFGQLLQLDLAIANGGMGEDCLHLNIWTPGLGDETRRPVMVSFHGGGYAIGSGNAPIYDGSQLARRGDVVVVTVTHRLGILGYLDLVGAGASDDFAFSGVCGLMDLVAALEWVQRNITGFGGDPGRVMIFGQSGGGWKVSALLGAPAAKGLFHRAAIQSGSALHHLTREAFAPIAAVVLSELGLSAAGAGAIRDLPWRTLLDLQIRLGVHAFVPVLDGAFLPGHPFDPAAPDASADVPLIVSTTLDDAGLFFPDLDLDEAGLRAFLDARYPGHAEAMLTLYRRLYPGKSPFLLRAQMVTDAGFHRFARVQAERKHAQGRAPAYIYQWNWAPSGFGEAFGAVHAVDVAASFDNVREPVMGGGGARAQQLARELSGAWLAFARTGDPNHAGLPHWPAYDPAKRATMTFGDDTRVVGDPDGELRAFWDAMPMALSVLG